MSTSGALYGADMVAVLFDSWPRGATVELDGNAIGSTPLVRNFDDGFFKKPGTVWNRYLATPSRMVLRSQAHGEVEETMGDGPFTWVSLDGTNRFSYYLLRHAYFLSFPSAEPPEGAVPTLPDPVATIAALEKLAELRSQGVLTEEEFAAQKTRLLSAPSPESRVVPPAPAPFVISMESDATALCAKLWPFHEMADRTKAQQFSVVPEGRILDTPQAPLLSCAWFAPFPGVVIVKILTECGAKDPQAVCNSIEEKLTLETPVSTECVGRLAKDFVAVLANACVVRAGGSVSAPGDGEDLRKAVFSSALVGLTE
jgi:hypothetical protein